MTVQCVKRLVYVFLVYSVRWQHVSKTRLSWCKTTEKRTIMTFQRDWNMQTKVYVGNLCNLSSVKKRDKNEEAASKTSPIPDEAEIKEIFSRYGKVRNVWMGKEPPGFAFIEYEDERDADAAQRALDSNATGTGANVVGLYRSASLAFAKSGQGGGWRN